MIFVTSLIRVGTRKVEAPVVVLFLRWIECVRLLKDLLNTIQIA